MLTGGIRHVAWLYATADERAAAIEESAAVGAALRQPVLIAVPMAHLPRGWVVPGAESVAALDMAALGRNPARILPALRAFAERHAGQPFRYLAEPVWPGRSAAEIREVARYEALLNIAFAGAEITAWCLYNSAELSSSVIATACQTHPHVRSDGREQPSSGYQTVTGWPSGFDGPLLAPPGAHSLAYGRDLRPVRALVAAVAGQSGLSAARRTDLVIAASEVAANTLKHTGNGGVIRVWTTHDEVLCQLEDAGYIADPLAGHLRPPSDGAGGRGLWLVNQVCDLAEIRTSGHGTTIRLHMSTDRQPAAI